MRSLQPHQLIAWMVFTVIGGSYLWVGLTSGELFIRLTYEDLYTEWAQLLFFVLTMVLATKLATQRTASRLFFGLLALAAFYTVMEEISWGQRLLQIETPDFFWERNTQEEMNVHNLFTGPESTLLKDVIEYVLATALVSFGLIYPLLLKLRWGLAVRVERVGLAAPPLYLWPFFVTGAVLELELFSFNEAEVAELLIGAAMTFMCAHYLLLGSPFADDRVPAAAPGAGAGSRRLGLLMIGMTLATGVLATGITRYLYGIPAWEERLEGRIINGMEKFGRRYEYRAQWAQAAEIYSRAYELRPQISLLHSVVQAYQESGDQQAFQFYYRQLLEQTIPPGDYKSADVNIQLSIMEGYRRAGLIEKANHHLEFAYRIAKAWVQKNSSDAEHVFMLGRVEQYRGEYAAAAEHYRHAAELDSDNMKYTQAYRLIERELQ